MTHTIFCEKCGKRFDVDEAMFGRRVRCKACQHTFAIPDPRVATAGPAADDLRAAPASVRDPEFRGPRPVSPIASTGRMPKGSDVPDLPWLRRVTLWGLGAGLLPALLGMALAFLKLPTPAVVLLGLAAVVSVALYLVGIIVFIVVPFFEDVTQGLLCFFVPFYNIFYLITRWRFMKRPFLATLAAMFLMVVSGVAAAIILPAFATAPAGGGGAIASAPGSVGAEGADIPRVLTKESLPRPIGRPRVPAQAVPPADGAGAPVVRRRPSSPAPAPRPRRDDEEKGSDPAAEGDPVDRTLADLKSSDASRRKRALVRLSRAAPNERRSEVAEAVASQLDDIDSDGIARADAARALGVWGGPEDVPALIKVLKDPATNVRWAAIDALKALKDPRSATALAELIPGRDHNKAADALRAIGTEAEDAVLPYLHHQESSARANACKVLQVIGTERSVAELRPLASGKPGIESSSARSALRMIAQRNGNPDPSPPRSLRGR